MNVSNGIGSAPLLNEANTASATTAASKNGAVTNESSSVSAAAKSGATQASDQASISTTSGLFSSALNASDVRTEKIAPIKAAIDAGTYNVSASDVADKLIDSLQG